MTNNTRLRFANSHRRMALNGIVALAALLAGQSAAQQPQATPAPAFDVASVHQNVSVGGRSHIVSSGHDSHFTTINARLTMLLPFAFGVPSDRIVGGPGWLNQNKYDIEAEGDAALDERMSKLTWDEGRLWKQQMVQALLKDRFQLAYHRETRELPIYNLVTDKGAPKLVASQANGKTIDHGRGHIVIHGGDSTSLLAEELAKEVGRVVIDKTGIEGRYDIDLKWTPEDASSAASNGSTANPGDASSPSLFTAIREQLGLKLESAKAPVEVIVIDRIEQPTPN